MKSYLEFLGSNLDDDNWICSGITLIFIIVMKSFIGTNNSPVCIVSSTVCGTIVLGKDRSVLLLFSLSKIVVF